MVDARLLLVPEDAEASLPGTSGVPYPRLADVPTDELLNRVWPREQLPGESARRALQTECRHPGLDA